MERIKKYAPFWVGFFAVIGYFMLIDHKIITAVIMAYTFGWFHRNSDEYFK